MATFWIFDERGCRDVEENPARKRKKKKLVGASGVNIVAKFRSMSFAATRVETYMDPDDVEPDRRRLQGGRGKQGCQRISTSKKPNAFVARTSDAYIRCITDTSSTCLYDSPSAISVQGRGVVVMAVMFVMLPYYHLQTVRRGAHRAVYPLRDPISGLQYSYQNFSYRQIIWAITAHMLF